MIGVGLEQVTRVLSKLEPRNLTIDSEQCSRVRHKNSTCRRCAQVCPQNAITLGTALSVDPEKCSGCGICATACPTGALEAAAPTNGELVHRLEQRRGAQSIAFACEQAAPKDDQRVIRVSCLGRLDESILVGASSFEIGQVLLVEGPCEGCALAGGRKIAERTVTEANKLLQAFGKTPAASFVSDLPPAPAGATVESREGLSRRAFFTLLTHETQVAAARTITGVLEPDGPKRAEVKKGELRHRLPARRQLLLESLHRIGRPASTRFISRNETWAACHFNETCMGCQMCALFCPTTALAKTDREGKPHLAFRVAECTGCGLCHDLCYWNSLALSPEIDLVKVMDDTPEYFACDTETSAWETSETKIRRLMSTIWKS